MYKEVQVLTHSSIKISKEITIYLDPFHVKEEKKDADIICITHDHFDHYSPEDIAKVKNASTVLVCPKSMEASLSNSGIDPEFIELVEAGDTLEINHVKIEVIAAYNVGKKFHPKENGWVGYVLTIDGTSYYVAGDTDINEDVEKVSCDLALLPVGGTYTMTAEEAAKLAITLSPKLAVPMHYGDIVGELADAERFIKLLEGKVAAEIK